MTSNKYLLDGEALEWQELIQAAKHEGYEEPARIYTTSGAASFLREHGHNVGTVRMQAVLDK